MPSTNTYYDLLDACRQDGCPICRLALDAVRRYLDSMNYDSVNDPGFQALTDAAGGFCNQHAAQWLRQANVLGTAMIYKRVLDRLTPALRGLRFERNGTFLGGLLAHDDELDRLRPTGACPACLHLADVEHIALTTLVGALNDAEMREAYERSDSLCWPHLVMALRAAPDADAFAFLRDRALVMQRILGDQLAEVIRKHDYRFRDEPAGAEKGSVQRAVHSISGEPGVDRLRNKLHGEDVSMRR